MADDAAPEKNTTGEIDPSMWDEAVAVAGRPQDEPAPNSTFAERAKAAPAKQDQPDVEADKAPVKATKSAQRRRKS